MCVELVVSVSVCRMRVTVVLFLQIVLLCFLPAVVFGQRWLSNTVTDKDFSTIVNGKKRNNPQDPDVGLDMMEITKARGYEIEQHS